MRATTKSLRLKCHYLDDKNIIEKLTVLQLVGKNWVTFDLSTRSTGFDMLASSILASQHNILRRYLTESGVRLTSCNATLLIKAHDGWNIDELISTFKVNTLQIEPVSDSIQDILDSLRTSPAILNLNPDIRVDTSLQIR